MARLPGSSLSTPLVKISNMRFERPLVSGTQCRDVPGTQRITPLPDFHAFLNCSAHHGRGDAVLFGNRRHPLRTGGGNEDAGGTFVEGEDLGAEAAIRSEEHTAELQSLRHLV